MIKKKRGPGRPRKIKSKRPKLVEVNWVKQIPVLVEMIESKEEDKKNLAIGVLHMIATLANRQGKKIHYVDQPV